MSTDLRCLDAAGHPRRGCETIVLLELCLACVLVLSGCTSPGSSGMDAAAVGDVDMSEPDPPDGGTFDADQPDVLDAGSTTSFPPGAYSFWKAADPLGTTFDGNTGLVGILLLVDWNAVETSQGVYDFSQVDARIAEATAQHLAVELSLDDGPTLAPAWILSSPNVQTLTFMVEQTPNPASPCLTTTGPVYWDPIYHQARLKFIAAMGARYSQDPQVKGIMTSFIGWNTEDWVFPEGTNRCESNSQDSIWLMAGYTDAKMLQVAEDVMNTTAAAFPTQILKLPIHPDVTDLEGHNGFQLVEETIAYANSAPWGGRFYLQLNATKSDSPVATDPDVTGATESTTNKADYTLKLVSNNAPRIGQQMYGSAEVGLSGNCGENDDVMPCTDVVAVLTAASDTAITYHPLFIEYFSSDASYAPSFPEFATITTTLGGTLRPQ